MTEPSTLEGRIQKQYSTAFKEYDAYERTLNALAALSFVLKDVDLICEHSVLVDFRPRLAAPDDHTDPFTPDGHFIQGTTPSDFILELKASWNDKDVAQIIKYAKAQHYLGPNGEKLPLPEQRCLLLGYQNTPGEENLARLFDTWKSEAIKFALVVFRYSLESSANGDRMFFMRVPYDRNGTCPQSPLGKAINSVRGFPISVDNYKIYRPRFHRSSDPVIPSYAAVLWWTTYARHYLTDEQKIENGRARACFNADRYTARSD